MKNNGGISEELVDQARHRVCHRLGDAKLTRMWEKLGPTGYFRKIRDLTHVEYQKIKKETNIKPKGHISVHHVVRRTNA